MDSFGVHNLMSIEYCSTVLRKPKKHTKIHRWKCGWNGCDFLWRGWKEYKEANDNQDRIMAIVITLV